ncbi:MAG: zinc ABC transporter substrate-binding protein [Marinibacterium sp.]|nr:zinc ABC transporter substrate-binding protein [Marinibacterium sp.]
MSTKLMPVTLTTVLLGGTATADVPSVAVDIAPVHSLVARVMDGIGSPDLVIPPGASPHEYNLRPSEAEALQNADVVFWMGEDLTPWLEDAVENLTTDAAITTLLEIDETNLLDFREGALFEAHDHGDDEHGDHDEHEHDDDGHAEGDHEHEEHAKKEHGDDEHAEDEHGHEEHAEDDHGHDHEEHAEDEHGHEGHDHGEHDPHAWLSPDNASSWLNVIAAKLSAVDPENAGAYFANAAAGRSKIEALKGEISATLDPARGKSFVVFHDAYQYFETAFDFPASGAISLGDAADPSPARIAEIQDRVRDEGVDCVLSEPQYNPGIVAVVLDGTEANTGVLDPLGSDLEPGQDMYPQLLRNLAGVLADCL